MKSTQVKSHKRKGRVVKSHSRSVKGAMKNSGSGMSAEECKAKYDAMVAKYGENSPQAKKLAMKMEGIEIVDKDARYPKGKVRASQEKIKAVKKSGNGFLGNKDSLGVPLDGVKSAGSSKKVKKHSRGDYMRKNVEDELLTKEAKKKYIGTPDQQRIKAMKATGVKRNPKRPANGFTVAELKKAVVKKKQARRRRVEPTPEANKPKKLTIAGRKVNAPTPEQRRLVSNFVNNWGTKKKK